MPTRETGEFDHITNAPQVKVRTRTMNHHKISRVGNGEPERAKGYLFSVKNSRLLANLPSCKYIGQKS